MARVRPWLDRKEKWQDNRDRHAYAAELALDISAPLDESIRRASLECNLAEDAMRSAVLGHQNIHRFRKERAPNLKNVAVHLTKQEFEARGQEFDMHEHGTAWKARLDILQHDPDAAQAGREILLMHRETAAHQVRVSRKAREVDHTNTAAALQKEVHAYNIWTGGHILGLTVKGRSLDYGHPQFFGTELGEAFVRQLVGKSGQELAKDFETFVTQGSRVVGSSARTT
ncbi:hypothetical protein CALVIDRAFT_569885 [Calocera viscosa TUFC12733]|uniref:Uncharacterized protein n=1 Tax=Calocera viscosa (strain TUFC12733) TaxID=1330018 RepID=A0A167FH07_CALVF|nr:hypothetical protein CALVIDRAFT_569885 [Calocera viscosa TUFC12733]